MVLLHKDIVQVACYWDVAPGVGVATEDEGPDGLLGPEVVVGDVGPAPGADVAVGGEFAGAMLFPEPFPEFFEQLARKTAATIAKGTANSIFI